MSDEYKKYDSDDRYTNWHARLAKDPEVRETDSGKFVRLTIVSTSRAESDCDLWIEVTPTDRQMEIASFLKKGDVVGIEGKPTLRKAKEGERTFFNLRRAELHIPIALLGVLKERGFVAGKTRADTTPPPAKGTPARKKVVDLDDE
jgi:single-stranded DNA-binding protein